MDIYQVIPFCSFSRMLNPLNRWPEASICCLNESFWRTLVNMGLTSFSSHFVDAMCKAMSAWTTTSVLFLLQNAF